MPGGTILVVDDEPSIRLLCRVNLELAGYRVVEAGGLEEARRLLAEEPVEVALLDVHVGRENGLELADELRRERADVSVVLLTGTFEVTAAVRERVDAVVTKPFRLEELASTVERLAAGAGGAARLDSAE